jgi:hypothetical protein
MFKAQTAIVQQLIERIAIRAHSPRDFFHGNTLHIDGMHGCTLSFGQFFCYHLLQALENIHSFNYHFRAGLLGSELMQCTVITFITLQPFERNIAPPATTQFIQGNAYSNLIRPGSELTATSNESNPASVRKSVSCTVSSRNASNSGFLGDSNLDSP